MKWTKKGLIFCTGGDREWMRTHASVPIADEVGDGVTRIYFGTRDGRGRSLTTFVEVDADDPSRVLRLHDRPVMALGRPGAFDDSGVMPSCVVNHGGRKYLFYMGWNVGVTVPYRIAVGLAVSTDGGLSFERVCEGPVMDRCCSDPYFCTTPFVLVEGGVWRMWYASCTGWPVVGGSPESVYQIKYAESRDGLNWERSGVTCIEYKFEGEANVRPCVVRDGGVYRMWYCYRGSRDFRTDKGQSYRLGYAESRDGLAWQRKDEAVGIDRAEEGWDSQMTAYPFVYVRGGRKYMLYNGNGFGQSGFGYAVSD
jgi:hypothetical protein